MSRKRRSHRPQRASPPGRTSAPVRPAAAPPWTRWLFPALIAVVTIAALEPSLRNEFVGGWDDSRNLLDNPAYRGLDWAHLRWMFTAFHVGHYMPLTWMTLGLDYVLWGMDPFGYHLTSLLLHAGSAVVLYFVAGRLLGAAFPDRRGSMALPLSAAAVALTFALHPLRVESVAWATERRDVLCGFFYLLAVLAYLRSGEAAERRRTWYWGSLALFGCALLSKSIAVSLPVVLLILDVYPLRRIGGSAGWWTPRARTVYLETVPFFLVAGGAAAIAFLALFSIHNMAPLQQIGIGERLAISVYSLAFYLGKTLAPVRLSPLYELSGEISPWAPAYLISYGVVGAVTALAVGLRRRVPGLAAAWLAYVVILLPVLGIFQNGPQIGADRYTYLACIGWAMLAGGGLLAGWRLAPYLSAGLAAGVLIVLGSLAWNQSQVWASAETLWRHALAVDPGSPLAHNNLGVALAARGRPGEAVPHYRQALELRPRYAEPHYNWALALAGEGRLAEAAGHYQQAVQIRPDYAEAYNNWGVALARQRQFEEAIAHFRQALRIRPDYPEAQNNWGQALADQGKVAEAVPHYRQALLLRPAYAEAHFNWANALANQGQIPEAIAQYQQAVSIKPDYAEAHNNWGLALERQGQLDAAIAQYQQAVRIRSDLAEAFNNWGLALARQNRLDEAITRYQQAVRINPNFVQAHYNWSQALARQGKTAEASERLQQAQRLRQ